MNILLVSGLYDLHPASGGSYLMREYVKELRRTGHTVKLLYFTSADADPRAAAAEKDTWYLPDLRDAYMASKPIYEKLASKIKTKLRAKTALPNDTLERYFKKDLSWVLPAISGVVDITSMDIVQVDFHWIMNIVDHLPKELPKVFVSHEAQFVIAERKGDPLEADRFKQVELDLAKKYDALLTLTGSEAELWKQVHVGTQVICSPMGIAIPNGTCAAKAEKLVFIGSGKHAPNLDGIEYFLLEVWPLLKGEQQDLTLLITGIYEPDFLAKFKHLQGVEWVGFVDSLETLMYGAISIVPIRMGSGIRVKILESMALGAAVVSTSMATEGIGVTNNENVIMADTATDLAAAIVNLYSEPVKYAQLAQRGQQFIHEKYDVSTNTQDRVSLFGKLLKHREA